VHGNNGTSMVKNDEINYYVPYVINIIYVSLKVLENFTGFLEICSRE